MNQPLFPEVTKALLDALDGLFPERCPDPNHSSRKIWMRAGGREVVRFLHKTYSEQQEKESPPGVFS